MLLKLFGAVILSLSGLLGGCRYARRLIIRRDFLRDFIAFLESLGTVLRYRSEDIFTSVNSSGELFSLPCDAHKRPFIQAWEEQIAPFAKRYALSKQDVSLLRDFGAQLGVTDTQGQLSHIALYSTLFEKQLTKAEEEVKSKAKLYRTLGLFTGMSAALMLI